jgi:hypothetical protein
MNARTGSSAKEPGIGAVLRDDIRRGGFKKTLSQDYRDVKDFFLDDERRDRLGQMGWLKRGFFVSWWLLKALVLKLTPARRLLLLIALMMLFSITVIFGEDQVTARNDTQIFGGIILLFILLLELKDKLIAQDELQAGRAVQQALMPESSPSVPGWDVWLFTQPANDVGGDLIDFLEVKKGRYALALGDVAGKGLPAALFMAKLQATLRALATETANLKELATKMNYILHRDGLPTHFASLIYFELSQKSGIVRLLNAGHMPAIVMRKAGAEEMPKGAQALGIMSKASFAEQKVTLRPGETLIAYSDGLTEARNQAGEFFGETRLMQQASRLKNRTADRIGEDILAAVAAFVGDAPAHDDLSMVIVRRVG